MSNNKLIKARKHLNQRIKDDKEWEDVLRESKSKRANKFPTRVKPSDGMGEEMPVSSCRDAQLLNVCHLVCSSEELARCWAP